MRRTLIALLLVASAACSPSTSQVQRITAIPTEEVAAVPTLTQPALPTEAESAAEPTSALAALAALGNNAPTPTPLNNNLPSGDAREIAQATDAAMSQEVSFEGADDSDENAVPLTFEEFYDGYDLRTGLIFSDKLKQLDAKIVVMEGYMAPPLKPELDYFVLTRIRLAFCPFCSTASDWPDDIALIYVQSDGVTSTQHPVRIVGRLEVGSMVDQETGMVSMVRIYEHSVEILN